MSHISLESGTISVALKVLIHEIPDCESEVPTVLSARKNPQGLINEYLQIMQ